MWLDVLVILAAVLVAAAVFVGARALPWVLTVRRRRVVVALDSDQAIEGVLFRRVGPLLELRDVSLRQPGGLVKVDGAVVIERARVVFVQVLG